MRKYIVGLIILYLYFPSFAQNSQDSAWIRDNYYKIERTIPRDIAHTIKKGHRLMIQVQSSWFPLVDRTPQKFENIYEANESDFQKATIRIYHDAINRVI